MPRKCGFFCLFVFVYRCVIKEGSIELLELCLVVQRDTDMCHPHRLQLQHSVMSVFASLLKATEIREHIPFAP